MDGEVIPIRRNDGKDSDEALELEVVLEESSLAVVQHPLDTSEPIPMRTRQEILAEALLLVPNVAKLLFRLLRDKRVPRKRRLAMAVVGAYVASPVDLVPDFIPVLGTLDDLVVMAFAVDYLLRASPPEVLEEHWDGTADGLELVRGTAEWGVEMLPGRLRRLVQPRW
jgi:uncharacterized membrane protein YkvA (DUF1232 family)